MVKLRAQKREARSIQLYGLYGSFEIPDKRIVVRYFSTFANSRDKASNEFALLGELKPMRERVASADLQDLNSLLQRDLNDYRVATELVPYLMGKTSEIVFFPAILGVLMPSGFIKQTDVRYPPPERQKKKDGNVVIRYENFWSIERFQIEDVESNLGCLKINPATTSIIVLDGQHRANAYRIICGAFTNEKSNDIYSAFYDDIQTLEQFDADLPVTLTWFENLDETDEEPDIDPTLVSRRLFVDVNNSARQVSEARTILLNDYEIPSLLTRFFYSSTASKDSFESSRFSLLHGGFDLDTDLTTSSGHALTLTNPQIIHYVMSWMLLGSRNYNRPNYYRVGRERFKGKTGEFEEVFNGPNFNQNDIIVAQTETEEEKKVIIRDVKKIKDFELDFNNLLQAVFYHFFNDFNVFQLHFRACQQIESWCMAEGNSYHNEVWHKVFCGGEGLYYTFMTNADSQRNLRFQNYVRAIKEIEAKFRKFRKVLFEVDKRDLNLDQAFESIRTKAFQVGIFMALDEYKQDSFIESYEEFIESLNKVNAADWVYILTVLKSKVISGTDPKKWPSYQKIILRVIQDPKDPYYHAGNFLDSPDGHIFQDVIKKYWNAWIENEDIELGSLTYDKISKANVRKWSKDAKNEVDQLFQDANIATIDDADIENYTTQILKLEIQSSSN